MAPKQLHGVVEHLRQVVCIGHRGDLDDGQLLRLFAGTRDEQAFAALVSRHGPLVHSVCRRVLGAGPDLDDVFQATFLVLARKARSIRKAASVGSWLHGVALRLAMHLKAQLARRRQRTLDGTAVIDRRARSDPVACATLSELGAILDQEVQRLPARYRDAVLLCHLEGLSTAEAAARLGCPAGTLKCRLVKARALLHTRLIRRGVVLSLAALGALFAECTTAATLPPELVRNAITGGVAGTSSARAVALAQLIGQPIIGLTRPTLVLTALVALAVAGFSWTLHSDPASQPVPEAASVQKDTALQDRQGDGLPAGARQRLGTTRWRHGGVTGLVAFLEGGKRVLSAADDGLFHLWEFPSGKEIRQFGPAFPDDRWHPVNYGQSGLPAAVTPDGKVAACYFEGGKIRLYDVATGKELQVFKDSSNALGQPANSAVAFSPDSRLLAVRQFDNSIRVWDWAKAQGVCHVPPGDGGIGGGNGRLTFTPDGKLLAAIHVELVNNKLSFSFRMWDPQGGKLVRTLALGDNLTNVSPPVFSPDGKIMAFDATDGTLRLLDFQTDKEIRRVNVLLGNGENALVFSSDSATLYARSFYRLEVEAWDVATGKSLRRAGSSAMRDVFRYFFHEYVSPPALAPDGDVIAVAGLDHAIHFVNVAGGKADEDPVVAPVQWLQFAPEGKKLWTQSGNPKIQQWNPATGERLGEISAGPRPYDALLSPDGKYLISHSGGDTAIDIVDIASGKIASLPRNPVDDRPSFAVAGKVLAVRWPLGGRIALHELPSGKLLHSIAIVTGEAEQAAGMSGPPVTPATMIVSSEGEGEGEGADPLLAAYSDAVTLTVWNLTTGRKVARLLLEAGDLPIQSGAFSPDRRCLALDRGDGTVAIWELASGQVRQVFGKKLRAAGAPRERRVGAGGLTWQAPPRVAFSPDGRLLAFAGYDRVIHVWAATTGAEVTSLRGHQGAINAIAFAPDGETLASASSDTTVLLWVMKGCTSK
jgi:RNA polymerase sigma factor (sigma-70 family)